MLRNKAHQAMNEFVEAHLGGTYLRSYIVDWCINNKKYLGSKDSIMPSDCCYNRVNKDPNSQMDFMFEFLGNSEYRCLGLNYKYNGEMIHAPKGKSEYVVGYWKNGVFTGI